MSKSDSDDGFRLVKGKLKISKKNILGKNNCGNNKNRHIESWNKDHVKNKISGITEDKNFKEFLKYALETIEVGQRNACLKFIEKLVCFGLGNFSSCSTSLHQLAFILEIQKYFHIRTAEFYDPVLSECEKEILEEFGWKLIADNCEGKYPLEHPSLLFLPHCPKQLTNNFLWENWNKERLINAILICNSFQSLINNTPERFLNQDAEYVLRISSYTREYHLENYKNFEDIFNDTSIHVFLDQDLNNLENEFWIKKPLPVYEDTELITKDIETKLKIS